MYLLILFLPLLNFISLIFTSFFFKKNDLLKLTIFNMILLTLISLEILNEIITSQNTISVSCFYWIFSNFLEIKWTFLFDSLTAIMLIVVSGISTCVHIYSLEYMKEDPHVQRFISYLSFFTFFMLILVTGNNLLQMFMGWEGVGLCSYLLINFWFHRLQANKAALKAMIVNRVGDFGLALGLFLIFTTFRTIDYDVLQISSNFFQNSNLIYISNWSFEVLSLISFLLLIGAVGKSAQIGLHTWLPDAMEGPTPVSALIHAATMVTAGVFLICRMSIFFEFSPSILIIVTILGSLTAFIAGTIGLVQNDLKRVIAYSTCSQLGYMVFACGVSHYDIAFYHLTNHAFFKAALFMAAGSVIHALQDEQDMRKFGGLKNFLFFTFIVILIGSLSLMGFPFLTGFFSKDAILEAGSSFLTIDSSFGLILGFLGAFTTAFYSIRSLSRTFFGSPIGFKHYIEKSHESGFFMNSPLVILSIGGFYFGYLFHELIVGFANSFWNYAIFINYDNITFFEFEHLNNIIKLMPLFLTFLGAFLSFCIYNNPSQKWSLFFIKIKLNKYFRIIYTFFNKKWFFDKIYNEWINQRILNWGYFKTYQTIDRGIIEFLGPEGLYKSLYHIITTFNRTSFTFIFHYLWILSLNFLILFIISILLMSGISTIFTEFLIFEIIVIGLYYIVF
jgi:proton-translocating NADH-quinone oxidoreductase chain L